MTSSEPRETTTTAATTRPAARLAAVVPPVLGLRARKKARTRAAIRSEAIRMFTEHGYAATTIEQIAEAADVSPSTFFRYFPTKEAVVITDEWDPLIIEGFRRQPAEIPPIRAFRHAIKEALLAPRTEEDERQEQRRQALLRGVPELRSAMLEQYLDGVRLFTELIAERLDRSADDVRVRTLAGALVGVAMSVSLDGWDGGWQGVGLEAMVGRFDEAMELLELGLPL